MIYTPQERRHLEAILTGFQDFIARSPHFDILYSEKYGYLHLTLDEDLMQTERVLSAESMIGFLLHEISCDVRDLFLCGEHFDLFLYPRELEESRTRAKHYIDQLPNEYRSHGKAAMEFYFNHCNDIPVVLDPLGNLQDT